MPTTTPTTTMSSNPPEPLAHWSHRIADIPERGLDVEREATALELAALAATLELPAFLLLKVSYRVGPIGAGRYRVKGELSAAATQACIITLEPVHTDINESFEEEYWPEELLTKSRRCEETEEREALAVSAPEAIRQGVIEVGRLIYEQLSTAIEPYPRAPGATFAWCESGGEAGKDKSNNPFAFLAVLKDKT